MGNTMSMFYAHDTVNFIIPGDIVIPMVPESMKCR